MGSALEDYGMSWMSSKIGGGGEIVVFTIDHFNSFVHGRRSGSIICSKKGTRQGSGLSPCIFTMPVDFAVKVAD